MGISAAASPMDAMEEVGALVREHAPDAEAGRRLAPAALDAMRRAGLFRMLLPRSLGGLEVDLATFARAVEAVARHDPAAAWALQTNIGGFTGARLPEEGVEEVYADPDALMAAAFHPPMEGRPDGDGYRLSGRRPLASGIHDAAWLVVTGLVGDGPPINAIVPASEVTVEETWDSLGMRGTDSNDVVLDEVFVPARRTFPLVPPFTPGRHYGGPLYRLPLLLVQGASLAPIALAIAREAIDELRGIAPTRMAFGHARPLSKRPSAHARLGRAEGLARAGRALLHETIGEAWERALAGRPATLEERAGDLLACANAVAAAVEAVDACYGLAGSTAIYERSPIERHFRDIQTIRHHGFVSENRFETVGQVMLGVEPEFALVAF